MHDIFIDVRGQDDNLGDTALRRGLADALRGSDRRMHFLTAGASEDYERGLGLQPHDVLYASHRAWVRAVFRARRPTLVLQPGEIRRSAFLGEALLWTLLAALRVKAAGGLVISSGVGVRDPDGAAPIVGLRSIADMISWRDHESLRAGRSGRVFPDWAFALGTQTAEWLPSASRDVLAVTLRFDRPGPSEAWTTAVAEFARRQKLEIVTFAQVSRDRPRAMQLASELNGRFEDVGNCHSEMDTRVRALFARSRFVLSDRVHALIIGATEGATPIGSAPLSAEKIERTLAPAGLGLSVCLHADVAARLESLAEVDLARCVDLSRARLAALAREFGEKIEEQTQDSARQRHFPGASTGESSQGVASRE